MSGTSSPPAANEASVLPASAKRLIDRSERMSRVASAKPYAWPYDGSLAADDVALVLIDMQTDFCGLGGYVAQMGYDVSLTRAPIEPLRGILAAARAAGVRVIHTREGHRPSWRTSPTTSGGGRGRRARASGDPGPCGRILVRGEPGWDIIPELYPLNTEDVVDKPGKGSFCATDLDLILRSRGIKRIILGGITTDVCVHTTMREANDRGYECLLLEDGCGATDAGNHAGAIKMVHMQHGVFGATATCDAACAALDALPRVPDASALVRTTMTAGLKSNERSRGSWRLGKAVSLLVAVGECALVMVDWQRDFCDDGGFGAALGNDVTALRRAIPAASEARRGAGRGRARDSHARGAPARPLRLPTREEGAVPEHRRGCATGGIAPAGARRGGARATPSSPSSPRWRARS